MVHKHNPESGQIHTERTCKYAAIEQKSYEDIVKTLVDTI